MSQTSEPDAKSGFYVVTKVENRFRNSRMTAKTIRQPNSRRDRFPAMALRFQFRSQIS
jgi:hypothetical protein